MELDLSRISEKQNSFLTADNRYVAYGGARGGGKSWVLRAKAILLCLKNKGIKVLIVRRTFAELQENHISVLQGMLKDVAKYNDAKKIFTFINGSVIKLGYCQNDMDMLNYQGNEYDVIFIDEATQFTESQFVKFDACVRGANKFPKRIYLTCNPGGIGHSWVKRLFIDKDYNNKEKPEDYLFIPASVYDNAVLIESDPKYVQILENLPPDLRDAWLYGSWDILSGIYFSEFDVSVNVIDPIPIQKHWHIDRTIDYGLDCFACLWIATDEKGNYYVIDEYNKKDKIISDGTADILRMHNATHTFAPPDLWNRSQESGKSKAILFSENGLPLIKTNNNREAGFLSIKELFSANKLFIFKHCTELIKCLSVIQRDDKNYNDCAKMPHDITHLVDALRCFCVTHHNPSNVVKEKELHYRELQKPRGIFNDNMLGIGERIEVV